MKLFRLISFSYFIAGILAVLSGVFSGIFNKQTVNFFKEFLSPDKTLLPQNVYYLENIPLPFALFGIFLILIGVILLRSKEEYVLNSEKTITNENVFSKSGLRLVLVSVIILYFELLLIRYLGEQVRILAYLKSITLMCVFLGMGLGCGLSKSKTNYLYLFPTLLFPVLFTVMMPFGKLFGSLRLRDYQEYFVGVETTSNLLQLFLSYSVILSMFFSIIVIFIALGKPLGGLMDRFKPLTAYSLNIAGSILGIFLFTLFSYLELDPLVWLLVGFALWLVFVSNQKRLLRLSLLVAVILCISSALYDSTAFWSPYYRIDIVPVGVQKVDGASDYKGYFYPVVNSWHKKYYQPEVLWGYAAVTNLQAMTWGLDLSDQFLRSYPGLKTEYAHLELLFTHRKPKEVLVLGSGFGSEVALAVRHNAEHVEAVEIDPVTGRTSKNLHPEQPFRQKNTRLVVDDARAFLSKTKKKYDFIVIGFLDSHALLSGMSSNRLDSFVYTYESFSQIKHLLNENGFFSLSFAFAHVNSAIQERLELTLKQAFPQDKIYASSFPGRYVTGPGLTANVDYYDGLLRSIDFKPLETTEKKINILTDNWPFIYLQSPRIPSTYIVIICLLLLISLILTRIVYQKVPVSPHFFFLGGGFLLLEMKGITELGILFGSTWIVNSFVIMMVLIMILLANVILSKISFSPAIFYGVLFAFLMIQMTMSPASFLTYHLLLRILFSLFLYGVPFFCAAIIFASSFKKVKTPDYMLGSNLLGSVLGGSLEYGALIWGIKSLNIIALAFYFVAFLFRRRIA